LDRTSGKNNQFSSGKDYALYYDCFNGNVYPYHLGVKGIKVNVGETVEVIVDLTRGKVDFKVSNAIRATISNYKPLGEYHR
jgi:hypothetical protein